MRRGQLPSTHSNHASGPTQPKRDPGSAKASFTRAAAFDDGTVLYTTARQQFLDAAHSQPVAAAHITAGDHIAALTAERSITQKKIVQAASTGQKQTVYNLKVEPPHKFIVSLARLEAVEKD